MRPESLFHKRAFQPLRPMPDYPAPTHARVAGPDISIGYPLLSFESGRAIVTPLHGGFADPEPPRRLGVLAKLLSCIVQRMSAAPVPAENVSLCL